MDDLFTKFQEHLTQEQEIREEIRQIVKEIEENSKKAALSLQVIHASLTEVSGACSKAREHFSECRSGYEKLARLVPDDQYYRYNDHWHYVTQRLVALVALTVYLEAGFLCSRETAAEILVNVDHTKGFQLEIEDYLLGLLLMVSELVRLAVNSVTLGDYSRPLLISRFVSHLNSGFRVLNLKNDNLRKKYDGLKYDIKKIEEIVYDLSIRGLVPNAAAQQGIPIETEAAT